MQDISEKPGESQKLTSEFVCLFLYLETFHYKSNWLDAFSK